MVQCRSVDVAGILDLAVRVVRVRNLMNTIKAVIEGSAGP
jgi:ribosomal protein S5